MPTAGLRTEPVTLAAERSLLQPPVPAVSQHGRRLLFTEPPLVFTSGQPFIYIIFTESSNPPAKPLFRPRKHQGAGSCPREARRRERGGAQAGPAAAPAPRMAVLPVGLTGLPSCPLRVCGFAFWTKKLPSLLSGPSLVSSVLSSR